MAKNEEKISWWESFEIQMSAKKQRLTKFNVSPTETFFTNLLEEKGWTKKNLLIAYIVFGQNCS